MPHSLVQRVLVPAAFIFLWSSAYIVVRLSLPDMSPVASLALRFTIATVVLLALVRSAGQPPAVLGRRWPHFVWLGLTLGVTGVVLVVGVAPVPGRSVAAALLAVGGIVCFAVGTIYFRRYCGGGALLAGNAVQMGSAAVLCAVLAATVEPFHVAWTWRLIGSTLYLALAVSVGAMGLFGLMLRARTAGVVSSNFYVIPGLTAVLAWVVLGETLTATAMLGFVVSSVGVWLAQREVA